MVKVHETFLDILAGAPLSKDGALTESDGLNVSLRVRTLLYDYNVQGSPKMFLQSADKETDELFEMETIEKMIVTHAGITSYSGTIRYRSSLPRAGEGVNIYVRFRVDERP